MSRDDVVDTAESVVPLPQEETLSHEAADVAEVVPPSLPAGPALVIAAHPDDPDFGCGGTMARLAEAGQRVVVVVVSDGTEGGEDPDVPDAELRELRQAEQRAALAELGPSIEVEFLNFPDGRLEANLELRRALTAVIRRYNPASVFTHDPTAHIFATYVNHPDHRAVGLATLDALYPAVGNPRSFRDLLDQGLQPHKVDAVYLFYTSQPDAWVDISPVIDRKIAALSQHRSQMGNLDELAKGIREGAERAGKAGNLTMAEGFRRIMLRSDD